MAVAVFNIVYTIGSDSLRWALALLQCTLETQTDTSSYRLSYWQNMADIGDY